MMSEEKYTLDEIATACMQAEVSDGQYESISLALMQSAAVAESQPGNMPSDDYKRGWEDGMKEATELLTEQQAIPKGWYETLDNINWETFGEYSKDTARQAAECCMNALEELEAEQVKAAELAPVPAASEAAAPSEQDAAFSVGQICVGQNFKSPGNGYLNGMQCEILEDNGEHLCHMPCEIGPGVHGVHGYKVRWSSGEVCVVGGSYLKSAAPAAPATSDKAE